MPKNGNSISQKTSSRTRLTTPTTGKTHKSSDEVNNQPCAINTWCTKSTVPLQGSVSSRSSGHQLSCAYHSGKNSKHVFVFFFAFLFFFSTFRTFPRETYAHIIWERAQRENSVHFSVPRGVVGANESPGDMAETVHETNGRQIRFEKMVRARGEREWARHLRAWSTGRSKRGTKEMLVLVDYRKAEKMC